MSESTKLHTEFAPAERAPAKVVLDQANLFAGWIELQIILDSLPVIVMILNEQRQMVYGNQALAEAIGVADISYLLGQRPGEIFGCIRSGDHSGCGTTRFCQECGAVKAINSSLQGRQGVEDCSMIRKLNGANESLDLRVWTTPLHLAGGSYVIFTVQDISSEKRRQALENIFLHDALNLTGALKLSVSLLDQVSGEKFDQAVSILRSASNRLVREIQSQRDLLAAETGELAPVMVPLDARAFLQEVVETYAHQPAAGGRKLVLDPAAENGAFESDPVLLGRVLGNMLTNALEACDPGDAVTVGSSFEGSTVRFWVHNPGAMPVPVKYQIFQRSFSTKGRGRGLGTYSMRLLSEHYLGGQVGFETSEERGTVFWGAYPRGLNGKAG